MYLSLCLTLSQHLIKMYRFVKCFVKFSLLFSIFPSNFAVFEQIKQKTEVIIFKLLDHKEYVMSGLNNPIQLLAQPTFDPESFNFESQVLPFISISNFYYVCWVRHLCNLDQGMQWGGVECKNASSENFYF